MPKQIYSYVAIGWTLFMLYVCLMKSSDVPTINIIGIDKVVHVLLHLFFTFFWGITFFKSGLIHHFFKAIYVSFVLSMIFGIVIEFVQGYFTTTRSAALSDVLANILGGLLGVALLRKFKEKIIIK